MLSNKYTFQSQYFIFFIIIIYLISGNVNNSIGQNNENVLNDSEDDENTVLLSDHSLCNSYSHLKENSNNSEEIISDINQKDKKVVANYSNVRMSTDKYESNRSRTSLSNLDFAENLLEPIPIPIESCNVLNIQEQRCTDGKNEELSLNNTDNLNVTDYVIELLNKRNSGT